MKGNPLCKCGLDWCALHPLDRFMIEGAGELVCRWCMVERGYLLDDPQRPKPEAAGKGEEFS